MDSEVTTQINGSLGYLQSLGFRQVPHPDELVYENSYVRISFWFCKSAIDHSIVIYIKKLGEDRGYTLDDILIQLDREKVSANRIKGEDAKSYVDRNLLALKSLIDNELSEVVAGKIWIDVPIDYGIYR